MAIRNARISLAVRDIYSTKSNFLVHLNVSDTLTIADANAAIATVAGLLGTVSDAGVDSGTFSLVNTAVASAAGDDSDVGSGAVFDFSNTADPSTYGQYVPSFLDSLIGSGGHIDITTGPSLAFANALIGAVLGGRYANTRYVPNAAALNAFRSKRKYNSAA